MYKPYLLLLTAFAMLLSGCVSQPLQKLETPSYVQEQTVVKPSGAPTECTVTMKNVTVMMYTKSGMLREETQTDPKVVMIMKNGAVYAGAVKSSEANISDCDWIKYDIPVISGTEQNISAEDMMEALSMLKMPSSDQPKFSCKNGNFGNEKFETPGKVCILSEILENMQDEMSKANAKINDEYKKKVASSSNNSENDLPPLPE